jgi:hypothetical protein
MNEYETIIKVSDNQTFPLWKFQLNIFLKAGGFQKIIDGTYKLEDAEKENKTNDWKLMDAKAQKNDYHKH